MGALWELTPRLLLGLGKPLICDSVHRLQPVLLAAAGLLGCAAPRLADHWAVGGARFARPLGPCLGEALRSADFLRYNKEVASKSVTTLQVHWFWLYGHYNDAGPRIVDAAAIERACPDGTSYLDVSAELAGSIADANPERIVPQIDAVVERAVLMCNSEVRSRDRARLEHQPRKDCAG